MRKQSSSSSSSSKAIKRWIPFVCVIGTLIVLTRNEGGERYSGEESDGILMGRDEKSSMSSFYRQSGGSRSFYSSSEEEKKSGGGSWRFGGGDEKSWKSNRYDDDDDKHDKHGEEEKNNDDDENENSSGGGGSGSGKSAKKSPHSLVATIEDDEDVDDSESSSSRTSGRGERKCGKHGAYSENLGKCLCSALYEGESCDRAKPMPEEFKDFDCLKTFTGEFEGDLAINRDRVLKDKQVAVTLPGKEKDPDGGYRVLVPNEEPLFSQFAKILPKRDEIGRSFFGTCAVVGSSGIVLNYDHGSDIDEHDMVFRFNSAPTRGFEKHVGSKTTYRITNTQNWGFHEPKTDESILIHFRAKSAIKGLFWNSKQKKPLKLYAFAPDFVEYVAQKVNFLATSGLYGILLALQRCHSVSIYGFQVSTQHGTLYHYYDPCDVPANVERDDTEWIVIRELAKHGFIKFAEPCVAECHEAKDVCDACKEANDFKKVKLPSRAKCDPNAVSKGHQEVPWRLERRQGRRRGGHGSSK